MTLKIPDNADEVALDFEGHHIRLRTRGKMCGRDCSGCPHESVVIVVTYPADPRTGRRRKRELWAAPPSSSGQRPGPPRTRRVNVEERTSVRGPHTTGR